MKINYPFLACISFSFLAILPNNLKIIPVILLILTAIIQFSKANNKKDILIKSFIYSSLFLILLPGVFYSEDSTEIIKKLTTRLPLFLIPTSLVILSNTSFKLNKQKLDTFLKINIYIGLVYALFFIFIILTFKLPTSPKQYSEIINYLGNDMPFIRQHPIYASTFLAIPFIFSVQLFFNSNKKNKDLIKLLISIIILLPVITFLARKGVILSVLITLIILFFIKIKKRLNKTIALLTLIILCITSYNIPSIKIRFAELFEKKTYSTVNINNSTSMRAGIYKCSIKKIKEAPFFGYGLGDVQANLNDCYLNKNYPFKGDYNCHNQYLGYFLISGVIGFLLLIGFNFYIAINAYKKEKIYLFSISIFFSLLMLFENILERRSGIIVYSFFLFFLFLFESGEKITKTNYAK